MLESTVRGKCVNSAATSETFKQSKYCASDKGLNSHPQKTCFAKLTTSVSRPLFRLH